MIPWLPFLSVLVLSGGFVVVSLTTSLWLHRRQWAHAGTLAALGAPLGMRYRVLGAPYLRLPEPFVLHERPRTVAENSLIERSLVSSGPDGVPAVFEYVTYRDDRKLRPVARPFLVLAARVPERLPSFRLRPGRFRILAGSAGAVLGPKLPFDGWILHRDTALSDDEWDDCVDWGLLQASGLWMQASGSILYVALPPRFAGAGGFTVDGIEGLLRQALPVLRHLGSPNVARLERLVPSQAFTAQPAGN